MVINIFFVGLDIEMTNHQLKDLLKHLDANGDGVVDAGEFLDAMRRHEESMQPTPAKSDRYHSRMQPPPPASPFVGTKSLKHSPPERRGGGGESGGEGGGVFSRLKGSGTSRSSPIRSLTGSGRRGGSGERSNPSPSRMHRELAGGGGGSLLSPSRARRASYVGTPNSPRSGGLNFSSDKDGSGQKPQWKN